MSDGYKSRSKAYALVGDCHGAALVAGGDVDWCALGRFDAEPALSPLLDAAKGGAWSIRVEGARVSRAYEPRPNVLRTVHEGPDGVLEVLDFMPVGRREGAGTFDHVTVMAPGWMVRRMRAVSGRPRVSMRFRPVGPEGGGASPRSRSTGGPPSWRPGSDPSAGPRPSSAPRPPGAAGCGRALLIGPPQHVLSGGGIGRADTGRAPALAGRAGFPRGS